MSLNKTIAYMEENLDGEIDYEEFNRAFQSVHGFAPSQTKAVGQTQASTADAGNFAEYMVPALTWAIFSGQGTSISIQQLERRIVTEWLPTSGYEYVDGPDIEFYLDPNPENTKYEVWVPVVRK